MSKLNQEELLEELRQIKIYVQAWKMLNPKKISWTSRREQAYQQIREKIQKPKVTEEFIKGKATEVYNLLYYKSFNLDQVTDFIRSLVEEIRGK